MTPTWVMESFDVPLRLFFDSFLVLVVVLLVGSGLGVGLGLLRQWRGPREPGSGP